MSATTTSYHRTSVVCDPMGRDTRLAAEIVDHLRTHLVDVFFFQDDPGLKFYRAATMASERSRMIVVVSPDGLLSGHVQHALQLMTEREERDGGAAYIIPVEVPEFDVRAWVKANVGPENHAFVLGDRVPLRAQVNEKLMKRLLAALERAS